jgi:PAT family beta-lactamase induction signal transducer AmpG
MAAPDRRFPSPWKIAVLSALYFAQGLPFGFQSNALGLYLTELGLSMKAVSFARALALPWALKALWAPLVDRYGHAGFGRRKSWIVPMQALLAVTCFAAGLVSPEEHLALLLALVLAMNLFAATQDVAVDGLAVDLLEPGELGAGNAAQVVGYKVGMLTGGGLLVAAAGALGGWRGLFFAMGALCLAVMTMVLALREPGSHASAPAERVSWRELVGRVRAVLTAPGAGWLLVSVATYKLGESLADAMFGPFLLRERGFEAGQVALWVGSWGTVASLAGSGLGGLLATRLRQVSAVRAAASLRVVPLAAQWLLVAGLIAPTKSAIIAITCAEHFFGGALTTAMFALMMAQVDRRIGATHFTVLASVEVWGKAPAGVMSGLFVDAFGFSPVFLASVVLSAAYVLVLGPLERALRARPAVATDESGGAA